MWRLERPNRSWVIVKSTSSGRGGRWSSCPRGNTMYLPISISPRSFPTKVSYRSMGALPIDRPTGLSRREYDTHSLSLCVYCQLKIISQQPESTVCTVGTLVHLCPTSKTQAACRQIPFTLHKLLPVHHNGVQQIETHQSMR